jgi:4-hydroxy-3-methylbut-2-en-1-yl diphosphate reductase
MVIIRSEVMGFCSGVQSAVKKTYEAVELGERTGRPVYTIGPLIHNEVFLSRLKEEKGVTVIHRPEDAPPGIAVIRAHGIPSSQRELFEKAGFELIDGTCRRVTRSQHLVRRSAQEGRQIIIAGNPEHGEVQAIVQDVPHYRDIRIIKGAAEIDGSVSVKTDTVLLSQTTFSAEEYRSVSRAIQRLFSSAGSSAALQIIDSICPATMLRQDALRRLIDTVDAVLVIGGHQSANTRRLFEMALETGKPAWHIAGVEEISPEIFTCGTVGITAGASTPEWLIDEVVEVLHAAQARS